MDSAKDRSCFSPEGRDPEPAAPAQHLRVAEVVAALSQALDLASGATLWHSVRSCILGMRIASEIRVPREQRNSLYYALLLKDAGSTAGPYTIERKPETQAIRCERGGTIARLMGLPEETAASISASAERWNGQGSPRGLAGDRIPLASRMILASQTLDLFHACFGPEPALRLLVENSGIWFDPDLVRAASSLAKRGKLWSGLQRGNVLEAVLRLEPDALTVTDGHITLDAICQAFAVIIDSKSPFTARHSNGVAHAATAIAKTLGLPESQILFVRHAALLHDIGKVVIPDSILHKTGPLVPSEWKIVHMHPAYTLQILNSIRGFQQMAEVAGSHHERLNGSGYFRNLTAEQLSLEARILIVADVFDALQSNRPYRAALPVSEVLARLEAGAPHEFDPACIRALAQSGIESDQTYRDIHTLRRQLAAGS